jgi:hypothetical protein
VRDTLRSLRNLQRDIHGLERRVEQATAPDCIDLFARAIGGDTAAGAQLRALGAAGKCGCMHELLDAIEQPLQANGGIIVDEDLIRPGDV